MSEPFNATTWKEKIIQRLQNWRAQMPQAGVNSLYGFLATMAFGPVLAAFQRGDGLGVGMALGSLMAGVGTNLLSDLLQQCKDESDVERQIAARIQSDSVFREQMDTLLAKLDVLSLAQKALKESDRAWFTETLRTELAQLGNFSHFADNIIFTDQVVINNYGTHNSKEALATYCRVVADEYRHLSLRGLDKSESDPASRQQRVELTQVYVDLLTESVVPVDADEPERQKQRELFRERKTRPLTVLEAVIEHQRLVLLGNPGSGKSTFLAHLALCLAAHGLQPDAGWLERLPQWQVAEIDVLPICITLRDFAHHWQKLPKKAGPHHLWNFFSSTLGEKNLSAVVEPLHEQLEHGQVLVLLDGLDEIPTARQRTFVRDAILAFIERYPDCRLIVTCRTLSYDENPDLQLDDVPRETLAPFSEEQINRFIEAWHGELVRLGSLRAEAGKEAARRLQEAIHRPDLWRLASNPLLLTAMALVHTHKGRLPDARALLYEETVDILLWRWDEVKDGEGTSRLRSLLTQAQRTDVDLKRVLWELAFIAHEKGGTGDEETVADISEAHLAKRIRELHPDKKRGRDWAYDVIEVMKLRAGLLLERSPEVYAFPHRTFQEYLAGAYLSAQSDFAKEAAALVAQGVLWREVVLLAVGRLVYLSGDTAKPLALVAELCPSQKVDTESAWLKVWVAGDVLLEIGLNRVQDGALGRDLLERVRLRLAELVREGHLGVIGRAAAGDTLGRLGDPRFHGPEVCCLPVEPLLGFIEIPAGPFVMGSDPAKDESAEEDEQPQHTVTLPRYYIAKYPVTVAQFIAFVEETKHEPADKDCLRDIPNHPVRFISWYDARAYCEWLTKQLHHNKQIPQEIREQARREEWTVKLPSEAEWEKAARGMDGCIYPWGNEFLHDHANTDEAGLNETSAVGCFLRGVSPYGCLDMAGNVWEWTRSLWENEREEQYRYPYKPDDGRENPDLPDNIYRVLRGGAFFSPQRLARCAYRNHYFPYGARGYNGVRVVVLPKL